MNVFDLYVTFFNTSQQIGEEHEYVVSILLSDNWNKTVERKTFFQIFKKLQVSKSPFGLKKKDPNNVEGLNCFEKYQSQLLEHLRRMSHDKTSDLLL